VEVDMQATRVIGAVLAFVVAGCAHYDQQGRAVRTGPARFDAKSVTAPGISYTLQEDGAWAGLEGDRYERHGDDIRKIGGYSPTPSLIRAWGWVAIDERPGGLSYTPSYPGGAVWIFVTEDGDGIPAELQVPLYIAAQLGLGGHWIDLYTPGSEKAGIPLEADCATVLFNLQGRQVAGFIAKQGAVCPEPRYPGRDALSRLIAVRNEVWESPERPAP
jgi:hypothetical protein